MEVRLNKWQSEVWDDTHRFRIVCAGRRSGKSVLSQLTVINWASKEKGLYWIVAPTYRQAKEIHWRGIQEYIPRKLIQNRNETELSIELTNGSRIALKGAENPDALRGVKLRGLVIDEIAAIRNWEWLWSEVLRPTLTDYASPAMFISTPKGYNHFYDLYGMGQNDGIYKSWRFTSYDNPYIPREEIDDAKKELTEDTFAQEYLADFRKFTGLAHKQWNREVNYIDTFDVPSEWQRGRGFDYGTAHFTGSPRIAIDNDDNWFIETCYLDNRRDIQGHAEAVKAQDFGFGFIPAWGDPSGAQWFIEFDKYNLHIQPASKEIGQNAKGWVEFGVEKINERLKPTPGHTIILPSGVTIRNAPRLFVLKRPENEAFVRQIENLKWRETATGEVLPVLDESGDPTGGHFDLMSALRYFAVSYKKPTPMYIPKMYQPHDPVIGI